MLNFILGALLCAQTLHPAASAQASPNASPGEKNQGVPAFVTAGVEAYKKSGPEEAVKAWIKGSPMEGSKDALSQSNLLRQIQDYYGSFESFDVVSTQDLTPRTRVIYLTLNFDKGPLFAKFLTYKREQGWVLTSFLFNTKDELVFPAAR